MLNNLLVIKTLIWLESAELILLLLLLRLIAISRIENKYY